MSKIIILELSKKHIPTIVMSFAMGLMFFITFAPAVNAEETANEDSSSQEDRKAAMKAQIESLRATIAERRAAMEAKRLEVKTENKEVRSEFREQHQLDRASFFSSLEGLSEEEKKTAMLNFIAQIREQIEARKTAIETNRAEFKIMHEDNKTDREAMKSSLLEKIVDLQAKLKARLGSDNNSDEEEMNDSEEDGESTDLDEEDDSTESDEDEPEDSDEDESNDDSE